MGGHQPWPDFPLGFVDASVIAICERLGERKVATLDHRHFNAIRPKHIKSFRLLPDA
jgi:predicted nucleic acid-binding protein